MSEKCKETVYPKEQWGWFHGYGCKKPVWKDDYCKLHHPESKAKRDEESRKRWEAKWDNSPQMQLSRALERIKTLESQLAEAQKKIEVMQTERVGLKNLVEAIGDAWAVDMGRVYEIGCNEWETIERMAGWRGK